MIFLIKKIIKKINSSKYVELNKIIKRIKKFFTSLIYEYIKNHNWTNIKNKNEQNNIKIK